MKYAAVIVETRDLVGLCPIIDSHLKFLDDDWDLVFMGSPVNEKTIEKNYPNAIFHNLNVINISTEQYNKFLTSENFWESLAEYDRVLIFQHDSMLFRKGIDQFLEWDYVGAPWGHFHQLGGNGGLSIRNPKMMLEVCRKYKYNALAHGNEDVYFCKHLQLIGGKIAPKDIAMQFSVETIFFPKPIGMHAADKYLTREQINEILEQTKS